MFYLGVRILHQNQPGLQGINYPSHRGCSPLKLFDTPTPSPTGGVKSSDTYTDRVCAILSYRRLYTAVVGYAPPILQ